MKQAMALVIILTGCVMQTGHRTTTSASPPSGDRLAGTEAPPNGDEGAPQGPGGDGKLVVPDLIGKTLDEANVLARRAGFKSEVQTSRPVECDLPKVPGKIKCQDPQPGQHVSTYAMIQVQVYTSPSDLTQAQLDPLKNMSVANAKAALAKLGWTGPVEIRQSDNFRTDCGVVDVVCEAHLTVDLDDDTPKVALTVNQNRPTNISAPPPD